MKNKVIAKELGSELMLYDPDLDAVHILNETASLVYSLYKDGRKPDEIEHEMRQRFALGLKEEVLRDIQECLAELRAKGLVGREPWS